MKPIVKLAAVVAAIALAAPITVFAAANTAADHPLTRAEVREQLVQVEAAGYNPTRMNPNTYPADVQAAEAEVAAQNQVAAAEPSAVNASHPVAVLAVSEEVIEIDHVMSGVGGVASGSSAAGAHYQSEAARTGPQSVFFGH